MTLQQQHMLLFSIKMETLCQLMTTSIGINFGSKILSKSTGVLLNGDMTAFSFQGSQATYGLAKNPKNFIEEGKRPMSSMCPSIL